MISVNEDVRVLYRTDSIDKTYFVTFKDLGIMKTNSEIIAESLSVGESVCSDIKFKLGLCEANTAKISMYLDTNVTGDEMAIFEVLGQFEPTITYDNTKGIVINDDKVNVLYEGSLSNIGSSSIKFDSSKYYLLIGKFQYTGSEFYIYALDNNNDKRYMCYYCAGMKAGKFNLCVPITGNDFQNVYSKLYSNISLTGYYTLYEVDYPIMPLGIFHVDSSKKSHDNPEIRDLIGFDKSVMSGLDSNITYTANDALNVGNLMNYTLQNTPLRLSIDLPEEQLSNDPIGYTILSQTQSTVSVPNPVYSTQSTDSKVISGRFKEYDSPNDPEYVAHKKDPKYHCGECWKKPTVIKPDKIESPFSKPFALDEDELIYIPLYSNRFKTDYALNPDSTLPHSIVEEGKRMFAEEYWLFYDYIKQDIIDIYGKIRTGKYFRWGAKCLSKDFDSGYVTTPYQIVFPAYPESFNFEDRILGRSSAGQWVKFNDGHYEGTVQKCPPYYLRTALCTQFGLNYDEPWSSPESPIVKTYYNFYIYNPYREPTTNAAIYYHRGKSHRVAKYHWPKDKMEELRKAFEKGIVNPDTFKIYSYDMDFAIAESYGNTYVDCLNYIDIRTLQKNTYIEYETKVYYGYEFAGDISKYTNFDNFQYKKQQEYDEGKITYYELLRGGVTQRFFQSSYTWNEYLTKNVVNCRINNFDPNNKYHIYLESGLNSNVALINDEIRNAAKSLGNFVVDRYSDVSALIYSNTTNSITMDENGNFQISYISKIRYTCKDTTNNKLVEDTTKGISTNLIKQISKNREIGDFADLELYLTKSPFVISEERRKLISDYLELVGDFLHVDRLGIPQLLSVVPTFQDVTLHYTGEDFSIVSQQDSKLQGLSDIDVDGYIILLPETFEILSTEDEVISLNYKEYAQNRVFKLDRDATLLDSSTEELQLDSPIYKVDDIEFYEVAKYTTNTYLLDLYMNDNGEMYNYAFNIDTDIDSIFSFDESLKELAESIGELSIDRQQDFLDLINSYNSGESTHIEFGSTSILITVTYISEISYTSNSEYKDNYISNNTMFSIVGPNVFNDDAIYVSESNRYYGNITVTHTKYQTRLEGNFEYFVNIDHNLSDTIAYIDDVHDLVLQEGTLIMDRNDEYKSSITSYPEYVGNTDEDRLITLDVKFISKVNFTGYNGLLNDPITEVYYSEFITKNALNNISYAGIITSNPVYSKDFDHYFVDIIESEIAYRIPEYKIGDNLTMDYVSESDILSYLTQTINGIRDAVLADLGSTLEVDRNSELIQYVTDYINDVFEIDESGLDDAILKIRCITNFRCYKHRLHPDSSYEEIPISNVDISINHYINGSYIIPTNAEPVNVPLTRQLYIEDEVHLAFSGVKIDKQNLSQSENYYPYYYNFDGTTGYNQNGYYYTISDNYFINNFILTSTQLHSICEDISHNLKNLDAFNLDATYHSLPYTEVCDKLCIVGANHTPGKNNDYYYTVILNKSLEGNIGMTDRLETEFVDD